MAGTEILDLSQGAKVLEVAGSQRCKSSAVSRDCSGSTASDVVGPVCGRDLQVFAVENVHGMEGTSDEFVAEIEQAAAWASQWRFYEETGRGLSCEGSPRLHFKRMLPRLAVKPVEPPGFHEEGGASKRRE